MCGWVEEHPHRSREREDMIGCFQEGGKLGKGPVAHTKVTRTSTDTEACSWRFATPWAWQVKMTTMPDQESMVHYKEYQIGSNLLSRPLR